MIACKFVRCLSRTLSRSLSHTLSLNVPILVVLTDRTSISLTDVALCSQAGWEGNVPMMLMLRVYGASVSAPGQSVHCRLCAQSVESSVAAFSCVAIFRLYP
jgi:hypothetical protein